MFNSHKLGELLPVEEQLAQKLCSEKELDKESCKAIREHMSEECFAKILAFSLRMAGAAVRKRESQYIRAGVNSLALDDDLIDPRDVYLVSSVLFDAASRLSQNPEMFFSRAIELASLTRSNLLQTGFLAGPSYMKSIQSMGVELLEDSDDFTTYVVNMF